MFTEQLCQVPCSDQMTSRCSEKALNFRITFNLKFSPTLAIDWLTDLRDLAHVFFASVNLSFPAYKKGIIIHPPELLRKLTMSTEQHSAWHIVAEQ